MVNKKKTWLWEFMPIGAGIGMIVGIVLELIVKRNQQMIFVMTFSFAILGLFFGILWYDHKHFQNTKCKEE